MMPQPSRLLIEPLPPETADLEIVERKGLGHPDTICDALAEEFSRALCRYYLERFGKILHHNVDKALLRGGSAVARFGGGEVLEPIEIYLAGRAVTDVGGLRVPVEELAVESARSWLAAHLHALDPVRHVRVRCMVRPGSVALSTLFGAREAPVPLANDTSFGVGFAPEGALGQMTLGLERELNAPAFIASHPAHGEDVKIMALRRGSAVTITLARAFIAAHVGSLPAYSREKARLESLVAQRARSLSDSPEIHVNAADAVDRAEVYLTVTGTSAEAGDDGQVGRGNRANGLITPLRPMSLEALAGKNPVNHVGKLYNVAARHIADAVVAQVPGARGAECHLVSRIGAPITEPDLALVRVRADDLQGCKRAITETLEAGIAGLPFLWRRLVNGEEALF